MTQISEIELEKYDINILREIYKDGNDKNINLVNTMKKKLLIKIIMIHEKQSIERMKKDPKERKRFLNKVIKPKTPPQITYTYPDMNDYTNSYSSYNQYNPYNTESTSRPDSNFFYASSSDNNKGFNNEYGDEYGADWFNNDMFDLDVNENKDEDEEKSQSKQNKKLIQSFITDYL